MVTVHENEVTYDIVRELSSDDVLLDLSVRNQDTNAREYYCEVKKNKVITLHRGGKDGPVVATAKTCTVKEGDTDLILHGRTITVHHEDWHILGWHLFPNGNDSFQEGGNKFLWKGRTKLEWQPDKNKKEHKTIAAFHPPKKLHVVGHLEMTGLRKSVTTIDPGEMDDLIILTALVLEVRADENREEFT